METETARDLLYLITTAGAVVWLLGLRFLIVTFRQPRPSEGGSGTAEAKPQGLLTGHAEVEGQPAAISAKAAAILAREGIGPGEPVKIVQRSDDRVVFEGMQPVAAPGGARGVWVGQGQFRFTPIGRDRTGIDYAVALNAGRGLLALGVLFLVLGLVALVAGFCLVFFYVTPHPLAAVRGQTFQMLQAVHFLWPPFLFAGLQRMRYRVVRTRLETLAHNLPYYDK